MSNSSKIIEQLSPYSCKPRKPFSNAVCCGDRFITKVDLSFGPKGEKIAKEGKKMDFDAFIQASLPSTDIVAIVAKAQMGDESVLNVHKGFTGDTTALPQNPYDYKKMNDLYDKVSGSFDKLPKEIKELFKNDSGEYLNAILNNTALNTINEYKAKQNEVKEGEAENA